MAKSTTKAPKLAKNLQSRVRAIGVGSMSGGPIVVLGAGTGSCDCGDCFCDDTNETNSSVKRGDVSSIYDMDG